MRIIYEQNHIPAVGKFKNAIVEDLNAVQHYAYDDQGTYILLSRTGRDGTDGTDGTPGDPGTPGTGGNTGGGTTSNIDRRISISATPPTSPQFNDIWIKVPA